MGFRSARFNARLLVPAGLCLLVILLGLGGEETRLALRYERGAIQAGEYWRLVSAHLVHLGWSHLLLNLAGFVMVWMLFAGAFSLAGWLYITLASMLAMDLGFLFLDRELGWYVGLSGLLHGLFMAGAANEMWRGLKEGYLLFGFGCLKLLWEQTAGPIPLTQETSGGPVIVNAHLYGAIGGFAAAATLEFFSRYNRRLRQNNNKR